MRTSSVIGSCGCDLDAMYMDRYIAKSRDDCRQAPDMHHRKTHEDPPRNLKFQLLLALPLRGLRGLYAGAFSAGEEEKKKTYGMLRWQKGQGDNAQTTGHRQSRVHVHAVLRPAFSSLELFTIYSACSELLRGS